jgi:DNA-binding transcriptional LysR family regulator
MRRYPDLRIVLETENWVVDLAREEVDVAIRIGQLPDSDLMARKLGTVELWPCASPGYLAERGMPTNPDELSSHTLPGWTDRPSEWTFSDPDGCEQRIAVPVGSVAPQPAVLQLLLSGGTGIGRLPDFLAAAPVSRGDLVRLLPEWRTETVEVSAVYPAHRSLSAKVPLFVDALRDHVRMTTAARQVRLPGQTQ